MAFEHRNLSVIAYANGWTLWNYKTQDKINDLQGEYFPKRVRDLMAVGDIIIVNATNETGIRCIKQIAPVMEIGVLN